MAKFDIFTTVGIGDEVSSGHVVIYCVEKNVVNI